MKKKPKRLARGRDWHGWAFYEGGSDGIGMCQWAEVEPPKGKKPSPGGSWVRVRFVRVRKRGGTP